MKVIATQKYVRMSPRKLRYVADVIRPLSVDEALDALPFIRRRAAGVIEKVVKSARANAVQKGLGTENLRIAEIQISEGPRLKRFRAVSRGRAHGIIKPMSHIRVILTNEKKTQAPSTKKQTKKIRKENKAKS